MKQLIDRLYGITQQGDIFRSVGVNQQNYIEADQWNVWTCTGGWGIFEDYSVESYRRDKSDLNETSD